MANDALFVENDVPVKFCFHTSITQGCSAITRDIQRHGGEVVASERDANVLLIDEQQDLVKFCRNYYHSREHYRLALYIESRGFVQRCIRGGAYTHERPVARNMPGRLGVAPTRVRVPFTEQDRDNLAYYLATTLPTRDGRMGNKAYKDLALLGQEDDPAWAWAKRHTWSSWREHYKMNSRTMDARIEAHVKELKGVGHHLGQDPRLRRREEEEETASEEEEQERERHRQRRARQERQRREQGHPAAVAGKGRNRVAQARRKPDLVSDGEEEEEESQRLERRRAHRDAHRRSDPPNVQGKRARISEAPSDEDRASGDDASRAKSTPIREEDAREGSPEIKGNDLFGDEEFEKEQRMDYDDEFPQAEPFLPSASPVPEQDFAPPSTQATLIAQSPVSEKERPLPPSPMRVVETTALRVTALEQTLPPSSQQVVAEQREVRRSHVGGTSVQQEPSMRRETRTQGVTTAVDAPCRNTRARSSSVEPERKGKGKGKAKEVLPPIEDVVHEEMEEIAEEEIEPASLRDEASVEGILELSDDDSDLVPDIDRHQEVDMEEPLGSEAHEQGESQDNDGDDDDDSEIAPQIGSRHQDVDMDQPSDSDDAETHASLVQGQSTEDEDMNPVAAPAPAPLEPRTTRSMAAAAARGQGYKSVLH